MAIDTAKTASEIAGAPKSPLPKLSGSERALARHLLEVAPPDLDPVVGLRLGLVLKIPIENRWRDVNTIDMALATGDIGKRIGDICERRTILSAANAIEVLDRRSRLAPLPVLRVLHSLVRPRRSKKGSRVVQIWDEVTAAQILSLCIKLVPRLFAGKAKGTKLAPQQLLDIASATSLVNRSAELASLGIKLAVTLEQEAGWQALEGEAIAMIRASLFALPAELLPELMNAARTPELNQLGEAVEQVREAEELFRSALKNIVGSTSDHLPIPSRVWASNFLNALAIPAQEDSANSFSSDAAVERLALVLITSWDAQHDGERAGYSFRVTQDIFRTGFDLHLGGTPGEIARFDPTLHEGPNSLKLGDSVRLARPWVEIRGGSDIQILIKGIVEAPDR